MSEKELNAYRLTSLEEPTDEMLSAIMKEAAEEARKSTATALDNYFREILSIIFGDRVDLGVTFYDGDSGSCFVHIVYFRKEFLQLFL